MGGIAAGPPPLQRRLTQSYNIENVRLLLLLLYSFFSPVFVSELCFEIFPTVMYRLRVQLLNGGETRAAYLRAAASA